VAGVDMAGVDVAGVDVAGPLHQRLCFDLHPQASE
jgi:hypothetical protein